MRVNLISVVAIIGGILIAGPSWPSHPQSAAGEQFCPDDRPALVVGVVIDQMKFEYLPRFWNKFGPDGFRRFIDGGFLFSNHHYNYFPTYTGPGHASIYTGTTPSVHGIVGNTWYDRAAQDLVYVVSDPSVRTVGADDDAGVMSPRNLLSTTVTDELKKAVPGARVIALSIKDRAAILPGGHLADAAFWYDFDTGDFVTSTWYMKALPEWVQTFNERELARQFSRQTWKPLLPLAEYVESTYDASPYERAFDDEEQPVFPHAMHGSLSRIITSPFGDRLLMEFVKAAISANYLGQDDVTDFLTISFSSPDYVGHRFGPSSVEIEDVYLRLDRRIADLLATLDRTVGSGEYLLFLTSDHGVVEVPASLADRGLPGGDFDNAAAVGGLRSHLEETYGDGEWVADYINQQVYLNRPLIHLRELSLADIQDDAAWFLRQFEGVAATNTAHQYAKAGYGHGLEGAYQRGFYPARSGDVLIQLQPGWLDSSHRTSHGSPYRYDTHVPLILHGWQVPPGTSDRKTVPPQIAPTLSHLLHIPYPSGAITRLLPLEQSAAADALPGRARCPGQALRNASWKTAMPDAPAR